YGGKVGLKCIASVSSNQGREMINGFAGTSRDARLGTRFLFSGRGLPGIAGSVFPYFVVWYRLGTLRDDFRRSCVVRRPECPFPCLSGTSGDNLFPFRGNHEEY